MSLISVTRCSSMPERQDIQSKAVSEIKKNARAARGNHHIQPEAAGIAANDNDAI
ncbi:MAG: hypothetical protein NTX56_07965 [Proteobacteria bacterium]|nr:hypothetical protein [Pseudomonadota bacterium]